MESASLWGWLLAACLAVLVGCCVLSVNAHNTLNEYKSLRTADIEMLRQEIVQSSLDRNDQMRVLINGNYDQLKHYMDVQISIKAKEAVASVAPIIVNQTANPALNSKNTNQ